MSVCVFGEGCKMQCMGVVYDGVMTRAIKFAQIHEISIFT